MMLSAARAEMRSKFEEARRETDPAVVAQRLAEGAEADEFIRSSIVQARAGPAGRRSPAGRAARGKRFAGDAWQSRAGAVGRRRAALWKGAAGG